VSAELADSLVFLSKLADSLGVCRIWQIVWCLAFLPNLTDSLRFLSNVGEGAMIFVIEDFVSNPHRAKNRNLTVFNS